MNTTRWMTLLLSSSVALAAGCPSCQEENLPELKSAISVDACKWDGVHECAVALDAFAGGEQVHNLVVKSVSAEKDLEVKAVTFAAGSDAAFSAAFDVPQVIPTARAEGAAIAVRFAPAAPGTFKATLVIASDAANSPTDGAVVVELTGTGREVLAPGHLTLSPAECDFGSVGVGFTAACDVTLGNDGGSPVSVTDLAGFTPTDPSFAVSSLFLPPVNIAAGATQVLQFSFTPSAAREHSAIFTLATTDPTQPEVDIPLRGRGSGGPTAVARVLSVKGQPYDPARPLLAGDDVVVTGADSTAAPGRTVAGHRWELVSFPGNSTVSVAEPDAAVTGFRSYVGGEAFTGIDVPGEYILRLTVRDDLGVTSSARLVLQVRDSLLRAEPATCGFGTVARSTTAECVVTLTNGAAPAATVTSIAFADGTPPAFAVAPVALPLVVAPGAAVTLVVRFTPTALQAYAGALVLGTSQPAQPSLEVPLAGAGGAAGPLAVEPEECDFGTLALGGVATCAVTLRSESATTVNVDTPAVTGSAAFAVAPGAGAVQVDPGGSVAWTVTFTPGAAGEFEGTLAIPTSLAQQPTLLVPLHGGCANEPGAVARILKVNGQPYVPGQIIRPLDDVVVTARGSAPELGRTFASHRWELVQRPQGSTAEPAAPGQPTTPFRFGGTGALHAGLDLVGNYTARVTITDDLGQSGTAEVSWEATATEGLHVQLTWDHPNADIDLHLVRGDSSPFSMTEDCHFANCGRGAAALAWGADGAAPHLDVDDVFGYGPENINVDAPAAGSYTVGVHYYAAHSQVSGAATNTVATVRIFILGTLAGEFTREVHCATAESYWTVARVDWSDTPAMVALDSAGPGQTCIR